MSGGDDLHGDAMDVAICTTLYAIREGCMLTAVQQAVSRLGHAAEQPDPLPCRVRLLCCIHTAVSAENICKESRLHTDPPPPPSCASLTSVGLSESTLPCVAAREWHSMDADMRKELRVRSRVESM